VTAGSKLIWVSAGGNRVVGIDPRTDSVVKHVSTCPYASDVLQVGSGLWIACGSITDSVLEIDLGSGETLLSVPVGPNPKRLVHAFGGIWVTTSVGLTELNASTGSVMSSVRTNSPPGDLLTGPTDAVEGHGELFVAMPDGRILAVDPGSAMPRTITHLSFPVGGIVYFDGELWVAGAEGPTLTGIDTITGKVLGWWNISDDHSVVNYDLVFVVNDDLFWFPVAGSNSVIAVTAQPVSG
jgi:ligand-binding sensor domain-containing protein